MTDDTTRAGRTVDLTVDIDATLDEVWHALTTGEGIARWFAPYATVTPGVGGSVAVGWEPNETWDSPITVWEPLRRMQTVSEMPSQDGRMVRLAVDYYLEAQGGRVRVRLVHSGFDESDSWDGYVDGLDAGWSYFLVNLKPPSNATADSTGGSSPPGFVPPRPTGNRIRCSAIAACACSRR